MHKKERLVLALGGNALLLPKQKGTIDEKETAADDTAVYLLQIIKQDYELIITHGNGPQVGNVLIQNDEASHKVPPMPLDVCVAETQGEIGYILQKSIQNLLTVEGIKKNLVTILTEVLVDSSDPSFEDLSKPVGPYYNSEQTKILIKEKDWKFREDPGGRGFRRVVASPKPIEIMQSEMIEELVEKGNIVISVGGGGIPVYKDDKGLIHGIEAVIDKDLASSELAVELKADKLIILTNVDNCYLNYKKDNEVVLRELNLDEATTYIDQGHFSAGSMGPKVQAAVEFVMNTGNEAIITSIGKLKDALKGYAGTVIKL